MDVVEKMAESSSVTKEKILESAKKEFLENGFVNATLRTIAANAGLTTGAMYRHFKDKDALFCALVDDAIEATKKAVMKADVVSHSQLPHPVSKEHYEEEQKTTHELLDYIYAHFDAFILLLTKAAGSTHENFLEEICDVYTKNREEIYAWMYEHKMIPKKIDSMTVHVIASTIINAFAEIIFHRMRREDAVQFVENITEFTRFGTLYMVGVSCDGIE